MIEKSEYLFRRKRRKSIHKLCSFTAAAVLTACVICSCGSKDQKDVTAGKTETAAVENSSVSEAVLPQKNSNHETMSEEDMYRLADSLYAEYCEEARQDPERIKETTYSLYTTQYVSEGESFEVGTISRHGYEMKYGIQVFGEPDEDGLYPLYIALHGGGGGDPEENDSQWEDMFWYYGDSVTDGIYVNPRGIADTWNLHSMDESYSMYDRLIEDMILFENADPNRIYVVGFSAGGDGVYQIAAHMADRFAAANMSSGHPNGVSLTNLANLPILLQAGIRDNYYDRNTITVESGEQLDRNAEKYGFGYEHEVYIHVPEGHNYEDNDWEDGSQQQVVADLPGYMRIMENDETLQEVVNDPEYAYACDDEVNFLTQQAADDAGIETEEVDSNAIRWVSEYRRDPFPEQLVWDLDTRAGMRTVQSFYYLKAPAETRGLLAASYDREDNAIHIDASAVDGDFSVLFNPLMLNLSEPVKLYVDDMTLLVNAEPSEECMRASFEETSDPWRVYAAEISYEELLSGKAGN